MIHDYLFDFVYVFVFLIGHGYFLKDLEGLLFFVLQHKNVGWLVNKDVEGDGNDDERD